MRLCADPKRLWRRYLVEPIILLVRLFPRLLRQRLGLRQSTSPVLE
jgi:UDP-N-acetyl-D-mannosaminuronic acid transferase (WecB/TagA/CpsF family)